MLPEIKDLYVTLQTDINVLNEKIREKVYSNLDDLEKFNWYQDWVKVVVSGVEIDYFLNDIHYKNMVANYMRYRFSKVLSHPDKKN